MGGQQSCECQPDNAMLAYKDGNCEDCCDCDNCACKCCLKTRCAIKRTDVTIPSFHVAKANIAPNNCDDTTYAQTTMALATLALNGRGEFEAGGHCLGLLCWLAGPTFEAKLPSVLKECGMRSIFTNSSSATLKAAAEAASPQAARVEIRSRQEADVVAWTSLMPIGKLVASDGYMDEVLASFIRTCDTQPFSVPWDIKAIRHLVNFFNGATALRKLVIEWLYEAKDPKAAINDLDRSCMLKVLRNFRWAYMQSIRASVALVRRYPFLTLSADAKVETDAIGEFVNAFSSANPKIDFAHARLISMEYSKELSPTELPLLQYLAFLVMKDDPALAGYVVHVPSTLVQEKARQLHVMILTTGKDPPPAVQLPPDSVFRMPSAGSPMSVTTNAPASRNGAHSVSSNDSQLQ